MKQFWLIIGIVGSFYGSAQGEVSNDAHAPTVVKAYIQQLKTGKVAEAVNELWDTDYFLGSSFGLTYFDMSATERKTAQQAFAKFSAAPFSNPRVASLFNTIEVGNVQSRNVSDSLVAVTIELTGNAGTFHGTNTMLVARSNNAWRIVDSRQGSAPSMRASIVLMWAQERHGANDSLSTVLERAAAETRKKTSP